MLSDTLHDNIQYDEILADIRNFRDNSDIYGYNEKLLNEISIHITRLKQIQQQLDAGQI